MTPTAAHLTCLPSTHQSCISSYWTPWLGCPTGLSSSIHFTTNSPFISLCLGYQATPELPPNPNLFCPIAPIPPCLCYLPHPYPHLFNNYQPSTLHQAGWNPDYSPDLPLLQDCPCPEIIRGSLLQNHQVPYLQVTTV